MLSQPEHCPPPLPALLSLSDLTAWLKIDRRTVYRRIERDGFPAPVKIGEGTSRWWEHEIKAWLDGRREKPAQGAAA